MATSFEFEFETSTNRAGLVFVETSTTQAPHPYMAEVNPIEQSIELLWML
jgi:hypothetical protein